MRYTHVLSGIDDDKRLDPPGGIATLAGRQVARIGFGAMQLPGPRVWGPPRDRRTALAVLRQAVELGVNHIDTAHFYGAGVSNELIRAALHPYPDDLVLVSKVGAERDHQGGWIAAQRPEQLRAGVEANLRSLALEQVGVVNLRLLDDGQVASDHRVDLDSQVAELASLRDEGKIGGIGMSNVTVEQLRRVLPAGIACVQNAYNVLDRSGEPLLELCREQDLAWVPYFPLGSAFLGVVKVTEPRLNPWCCDADTHGPSTLSEALVLRARLPRISGLAHHQRVRRGFSLYLET